MVAGSCVRRHDSIVERRGFIDGGFVLSLDAKGCVLQLLLALQTLLHPHLPATLKHTPLCDSRNSFLTNTKTIFIFGDDFVTVQNIKLSYLFQDNFIVKGSIQITLN